MIQSALLTFTGLAWRYEWHHREHQDLATQRLCLHSGGILEINHLRQKSESCMVEVFMSCIQHVLERLIINLWLLTTSLRALVQVSFRQQLLSCTEGTNYSSDWLRQKRFHWDKPGLAGIGASGGDAGLNCCLSWAKTLPTYIKVYSIKSVSFYINWITDLSQCPNHFFVAYSLTY